MKQKDTTCMRVSILNDVFIAVMLQSFVMVDRGPLANMEMFDLDISFIYLFLITMSFRL